MQLHQLLRITHTGANIIIFDMQGVEIFRCRSKESIPTDLYEYEIFEVSVGWKDLKTQESALYITLQK